MPVDAQHPLYQANVAKWRMCRLAYEGEDAVKGEGEAYLPKVDPAQTSREYDAYRARALFYDAVSRTVDGFCGAMSRKPHVVSLPAKLAVFEMDTTADGTGLREFIKRLATELLLNARAGILVDYDEARQRAYLTVYQAEAILDWSDTEVRLIETIYETDESDPFKRVAVEQVRQLQLIEGRYVVTVWRKPLGVVPGTSEWAVFEQTTPTRRGAPLDVLPWFWASTLGRTPRIAKPPLLGLVSLAMSHYRSSADLEHGRHFAGLPTLWVSGCTSDEAIRVGGATAILLSDPAARVGYAEFTGQGLGSLEKALETKEYQMAALGAAIFAESRKGVEAAETARLRSSAETSLLSGIVSAIEETLEAALRLAAEWMGAGGDAVDIEINRDFVDATLEPAALVALVQAFQAGAVSLETFLFNLQQGEMLPPEMDVTAEAAKLEAAAKAKAITQAPPAAAPNTGGVE